VWQCVCVCVGTVWDSQPNGHVSGLGVLECVCVCVFLFFFLVCVSVCVCGYLCVWVCGCVCISTAWDSQNNGRVSGLGERER